MTNVTVLSNPVIEHKLYEQPVYSDWVVSFWYHDDFGNSTMMGSKLVYNCCTAESAINSAYLGYVIIRGSVKKSAQRVYY